MPISELPLCLEQGRLSLVFCYFFVPLTELRALKDQRMMFVLPWHPILWQSLAQGKGGS